MFIRHNKTIHRDHIAILRSHLRLRGRSLRDSRSIVASLVSSVYCFMDWKANRPSSLFHLYPPLVPRPLFGLNGAKVSLFISLPLPRALERVYARIRFQSLKAGREGGHCGRAKVARATRRRHGARRHDCRFKAGRPRPPERGLHSLSLGHDGG